MPILSIIILSYNTRDLTIACIESLVSQYKEELTRNEFEIILVDNKSSDETVATINNSQLTIHKKYLKVIRNKENYGFSKGNNIGAQKGRGKYFFFLNSDTEVHDKGLTGMVNFLEREEKVAVLGAKISNADGTPQPSTGVFYNLLAVKLMLLGLERLGFLRSSPSSIKPVDWVSGAAMMGRKAVFDKLGGFDENFFMYIEDMELCFRVKKAGYHVYFYPDIEIIHKNHGSGSRSFAIIHIYKGLLYFYKKHKSSLEYNLVRLMLLKKALFAEVFGKVTGNIYLVQTYSEARKVLT